MNKKALTSFGLPIALLLSNSASAITINNFSNWGISTSNLSTSVAGVFSVVEDQHSDFLNPGYGGQQYDAEGIYATWDTDYLYVAVITGRKQNDTAGGSWAPGDIAFDLGSNHSFEYGLVTSSSNGGTPASNGIGSPGDFYNVSTWNYGLWNASGAYVGFGAATADHNHPQV